MGGTGAEVLQISSSTVTQQASKARKATSLYGGLSCRCVYSMHCNIMMPVIGSKTGDFPVM